ncbi:probable LRR receptor-like serine/threonine-protein kinase At1g05700 isoform X2 [Nymphaea colorata]|uniref:probable LRR receptor-like serine/threonine-protein kinase At1g05700 isoform X2 n=1 Tax=Nymphaea colorata TaxID=210225 RepID=UPI00214F330A|nr:probable LRR receptor-like serine/threonine-protein kinase At1g05700 isoform X2 [Nymphaea colorata]
MSTLLTVVIFGSLLWEILVHLSLAMGQPSAGFINIDCGSHFESNVDPYTNVTYFSDSKLMEFGEIKSPDSSYIEDRLKYLWKVRTFPKGNRTCYKLQPVTPGSKYLIRPNFLYGNFDGLNSFPQFDLYLDNTFAQTVNASVSEWQVYEFIVKATRSCLTLCLCRTNERDPFISAIELRPMPDAIYPVVNATLALNMLSRQNFGRRDRNWYRFPDDTLDRIWWSPVSNGLGSINTTESISPTDDQYVPPSFVMQTADINLDAKRGIQWSSTTIAQDADLFMCIHFAELKKLEPNETREFDITVDSKPWHGAFSPTYLTATTLCSTSIYRSQNNLVEFNPTERSTLSPIVNAMELYAVLQLSGSATDDADASSLVDIRDEYRINKTWTGDPCLPLNYTWEGLVCSNNTFSPRVISLDLSNSGLSGQIPSSLANFAALVNLNLSGNNLTGNIPVFLANLPQLEILDLSDNDLGGCMPDELKKKLESGSLKFRSSGNEKLLSSGVCTPHRKQSWKRLTIGTTVSAALLFLLLASSIIFVKTKKRNPPGEKAYSGSSKGSVDKNTGCQVFTYSEVVAITINFKQKIGQGGFGSVYLGHLQGQDVAVKMISHKSKQGSKEFYTEVALLSRVHHRNLVHFIGYCDEDENMILLYEFLSSGNLGQALSEVDLDWNRRLQIALDAAQGLDYLHAGCKPAIIHRDVKSTNILLNDKFEAKIADFGLSKSGMPDGFSHVSTVVAGTPGYLDPEYSTSCWLNEKSDVYSFGVVLLELFSGKLHVIDEASNKRIHIVEWVQQNVLRRNHANVADPRLCGRYDVGSLWRVVDLALLCTRDKGINRPNMSYVVTELKEVIMLCGPTQVQHELEECNYSQSSGSAPMVLPFPTSL